MSTILSVSFGYEGATSIQVRFFTNNSASLGGTHAFHSQDDESLRRWKEQLLGSVDFNSVGGKLALAAKKFPRFLSKLRAFDWLAAPSGVLAALFNGASGATAHESPTHVSTAMPIAKRWGPRDRDGREPAIHLFPVTCLTAY